MKRFLALIVLAACAATACTDQAQAKKEGLGKATADAKNDTDVLGKAEAAANEVLAEVRQEHQLALGVYARSLDILRTTITRR